MSRYVSDDTVVLTTCAFIGVSALMILFLVLWIIKPQHVDKVITKTVTVPAQFQYSVGESVYVQYNGNDDCNDDITYHTGTVVGVQNSGNNVSYIVRLNCNNYYASQTVDSFDPSYLAKESTK